MHFYYRLLFYRLRESTFNRLLTFSLDSNSEKSLSKQLDRKLLNDPIYPVLDKPHMLAIDRRLKKIFEVLEGCFVLREKENVLLFHY